jgi:glucokinase
MPVGLRTNDRGESAHWVLGFDIGGTKTAALAGNLDGQILDRIAFASQPERGFDPMWDDIVAAGRGLIGRHGLPESIGVSIGGPLDAVTGIIYSPPNLPGWDKTPLKQMLEHEFGVPAEVEHDAKACALAEWLFGAARGKRNVVFLTFGTGLGAGLILDGRLYRGASDVAGEVGHWRMAPDGPLVYGKRGSWEGFSSGSGIAALARAMGTDVFPPDVSAADVVERARAGDVAALEVVERASGRLGEGLALLVDLLNPEMIVLGSLAVRAGDLILPIARRVMWEEALPQGVAACEVVPAALGDQIGDVAALCPVVYRKQLAAL